MTGTTIAYRGDPDGQIYEVTDKGTRLLLQVSLGIPYQEREKIALQVAAALAKAGTEETMSGCRKNPGPSDSQLQELTRKVERCLVAGGHLGVAAEFQSMMARVMLGAEPVPTPEVEALVPQLREVVEDARRITKALDEGRPVETISCSLTMKRLADYVTSAAWRTSLIGRTTHHLGTAREALRLAAERFREYERSHQAKADCLRGHDHVAAQAKADRNRQMAELCEQALQGQEPQVPEPQPDHRWSCPSCHYVMGHPGSSTSGICPECQAHVVVKGETLELEVPPEVEDQRLRRYGPGTVKVELGVAKPLGDDELGAACDEPIASPWPAPGVYSPDQGGE